MTNHKCGTCRFYEVGAQRTHGWCRNPAYPRRDDGALLRNDELACRSGWGKDFWAARDSGRDSAMPNAPSNEATTQPIPVPIGTGIADHQTPALTVAARMPAATGMSARQDGAQGAMNAVSVPARPLTTAPEDGTMGTTRLTLPLSNHPELNENGVPIRPPRRTIVAEAHRRAMERRAQERQTKEEHDRLAVQAALKEADTLREQQLQATSTEPKQEQRPILGGSRDFGTASLGSGKVTLDGAPKGERTTIKRELTRTENNGPKRELARPAIPAPIMPRTREHEIPQGSASSGAEAEDMIISTTEAFTETVKGASDGAARTPEATTQAGPDTFRTLDPAPEPAALASPVSPVSAPILPPTPPSNPPTQEAHRAPYWDQVGMLKGPRRFRPEGKEASASNQSNDKQSVRQVGRPMPIEQPKPIPTRAIKPRGAVLASAPEVAEERAITPPVRTVKPAPEVGQLIAPPAAPPVEPAPRQIDESLLRQLENDWQAHQRAIYSDQSCGTCRFFQTQELGRGSCNCPFAPVYRQQTETEALPCVTALGVWWAAPDKGWLERTERRPRRETPELDALLREREAIELLHNATPSLRRGAR